jgi:hypothetical protein
MSLKKSINRVMEAIEKAKKLTTKDRKKLKSSTFCGPNRSFPVPDCKHVAVAKAYLGRSKFSQSTKQRIAACINRKAKALGCSVSKKAKASSNDLPKDLQKLGDSVVFKTTRELVDQSIENEGMELDFASCE